MSGIPATRVSVELNAATISGRTPAVLHKCRSGADKVAADARTVAAAGISGTPTLLVDGKVIAGFQQAELEAFLARPVKVDTDAQ